MFTSYLTSRYITTVFGTASLTFRTRCFYDVQYVALLRHDAAGNVLSCVCQEQLYGNDDVPQVLEGSGRVQMECLSSVLQVSEQILDNICCSFRERIEVFLYSRQDLADDVLYKMGSDILGLEALQQKVQQKEEVVFSECLVGCFGLDCLHLSWDTSQWRTLGHEIINHEVLYSVGEFLIR
jgi:hypothetical protein